MQMGSWNHLNPQQQQAVTAGLGPILVLAGPGSGKTRVLTQRIAYLVSYMGVRPYHILAVTFTNKAAREMEHRVLELVGENGHGLTLGTFHATCAKILRRESENLPFESNFVIFDADDQLSLVKRAINDLNIDEKKYRAPGVHASISNAKNELLLPDQFPIQNYRDEVVKRIYKRYSDLLLANNALDFDDLLLWTAYLLEEYPAVREKYARRYEHVLVDEFQDTNQAQYVLLKHLASYHNNILVVGDTDQSIYRWRGADYRNVLRFEQDYPDATVILLEQNYRSTQSILNAAMAVIDRNPYRTPKRLFTDRGDGLKPVLYEAVDDRHEANYIVDTILSLINRGASPGEFAVMYRTNAQSRLLEEAFLAANLPYKLVGAQRFYGRREVKDLISYLRLIHNPNDELSLTRIINTPTRGIGDKTFLTLRTQAQKANLSPGEMVLNFSHGKSPALQEQLSGRSGAALANFGSMLTNWIALKNDVPPLNLMDRILTDTDYQAYIDDGTDTGQDRWDNIMEMRRLAAEFEEAGLEAFLEQVALVSDQDTLESGTGSGANTEAKAEAPTLLTLHAAKGLEYPVVFLTGLNDGTLPHSRSFEDPEAMMEERRLFYVGITRSKDLLFLVYSQNRTSYGFSEPADPSRFLADIPASMLQDTTLRSRIGNTGSTLPLSSSQADRQAPNRPDRWQLGNASTSPGSSPPVKQRFSPGMQVIHPSWGEGMVLSSRIQDDDEILDIFFANVGLKRLAASLAKLEIKT